MSSDASSFSITPAPTIHNRFEVCCETSGSGQFLQVLLANVLVKIGAVFTVALPLVWLGGLLYHCTSGETLQVSLFKVYAVLYRAPGMLHPAPYRIVTRYAAPSTYLS